MWTLRNDYVMYFYLIDAHETFTRGKIQSHSPTSMIALKCLLSASAPLTRPPLRVLQCLQSPGSARTNYSSLARRSMLMLQFDRIKKQYQDYILLFQVGDFYEIYGDDASKCKVGPG